MNTTEATTETNNPTTYSPQPPPQSQEPKDNVTVRINGTKTVVTLPHVRYLPLIQQVVGNHHPSQAHGGTAALVVLPTGSPLVKAVVALVAPNRQAEFDAADRAEVEAREKKAAYLAGKHEERQAFLKTLSPEDRQERYWGMFDALVDEELKEAIEYAEEQARERASNMYIEDESGSCAEEAAEEWLLDDEKPEER